MWKCSSCVVVWVITLLVRLATVSIRLLDSQVITQKQVHTQVCTSTKLWCKPGQAKSTKNSMGHQHPSALQIALLSGIHCNVEKRSCPRLQCQENSWKQLANGVIWIPFGGICYWIFWLSLTTEEDLTWWMLALQETTEIITRFKTSQPLFKVLTSQGHMQCPESPVPEWNFCPIRCSSASSWFVEPWQESLRRLAQCSFHWKTLLLNVLGRGVFISFISPSR